MLHKDLYELCEICGGAGTLPPGSQPETRFCGISPGALVRRNDGVFVCPACGGRRFVETGLSVGQVERIVRENGELRARVAELEGWSADLHGGP